MTCSAFQSKAGPVQDGLSNTSIQIARSFSHHIIFQVVALHNRGHKAGDVGRGGGVKWRK